MSELHQLSPEEHDNVVAMDAPLRYKHFIERVADTQLVFGLRTSEGWVSACDDDGAEGLPLWPHPGYALECATGEWAGATPAEIDVYDFANEWLPAMAADGISAIVFPTPSAQGVPVTATQLQADLNEELSRYD